ncbi:hypothetical protein BGZ94_005131 [Podila epigama]|nr:hypothetical protein BGZ94_005131 [Podila epigama]
MEAIVSLYGSKTVAISFDASSQPTVLDLKEQLADLYQIPVDEQRLRTAGGLALFDECEHEDEVLLFGNHEHCDESRTSSMIRYFGLSLRLAGGKGGFGSMLRAQGGRMSSQKATNTDACRDLSGRRIKTVKDAKNMAEYLRQEPEREKAKKESLKRKIEEKQELASRPTRKHRFEDSKFFDEAEEQVEDVKNAVAAALKESLKASSSSSSASSSSSSSSLKRSGSGSDSGSDSGMASSSSLSADIKGKGKAKDVTPVTKKPAKSLSMWDDMSDYESSEEEEDEDEEEEEEEEEEAEEVKEEEKEVKPEPRAGSSRSTRSRK